MSYPFSWFYLRREADYPKAHRVRKVACSIFLRFVFLFPKVVGAEKLSQGKAYLIIANHSSLIDIIVSMAVLDSYHCYMPKIELGKFPVFGIYFYKIDIPVDRNSKKASRWAYEEAVAKLKKKESVLVYPEGGIPDCAPSLGRFKFGPFKMALESGTTVLPIVFPDNHEHFPYDGRWRAKPGRVRLVVLDPVEVTNFGKEDLSTLRDQCWETMNNALKRYED